MRDFIDHHARDMMLDLTGQRRDVPQMGRAEWCRDFVDGVLASGPAGQERAGQERAGAGTACGTARAGAAEAVGGDFGDGGGGSSGEAVQAAQWPEFEGDHPELTEYRMIVAKDDLDDALVYAADALSRIYTAVTTYAAAAGPMPLASAGPWVEGDENYRQRVNRHRPAPIWTPDHLLDVAGTALGLPRAHLMPVEPRP